MLDFLDEDQLFTSLEGEEEEFEGDDILPEVDLDASGRREDFQLVDEDDDKEGNEEDDNPQQEDHGQVGLASPGVDLGLQVTVGQSQS